MTLFRAALKIFFVFTLGGAAAQADSPGCALRFKKQKLCADIAWTKPPAASTQPGAQDLNAFTLKFQRPGSESTPTDPAADVRVRLWMPEMGHGGPMAKIAHADVGTYRVSEVVFTMPGRWELQVLLLKNNKPVDTATLKYDL